MKKIKHKKLVSYSISGIIALAIALGVAVHQGFALSAALYLNFRYLSDGFFVAGVLFTGIGLLTWVSTTGFFDMFSFAIKRAAEFFIPRFLMPNAKTPKHFYDYKMAREEARKKPLTTLLFTGIALLAFSLLCWGLYYGLQRP